MTSYAFQRFVSDVLPVLSVRQPTHYWVSGNQLFLIKLNVQLSLDCELEAVTILQTVQRKRRKLCELETEGRLQDASLAFGWKQ